MPFADALTPLFGRLRAQYQQTSLPSFLSWWGGQLRRCLPQRWQAMLAVQESQLWLRLDAGSLQLQRVGTQGRHTLGEWALEALPDNAEFEKRVGESAANQQRVLLLPSGCVLNRRLSLPAAAVGNARTLVGFEIDRQTPFRADQVEFDCRIGAVLPAAKQVAVELAVVPREVLRAQLAAIGPLAAQLDAVDSQSGDGRAGFNFLPLAQRRPRDPRAGLVNSGLLVAGILLLMLAMAQLVENRRIAVAGLEADVEAQRTAARGTGELRRALEDAVTAANFLAEQRRRQPSMVELLRVLTETLPDDTFVERMTYSGDTVSITVQSDSAAKLVERFEASGQLTNPALVGAIQDDPRSGKDRATLTAQFVNVVETTP